MQTERAHAERLARALESTGLCQPVEATHTDNRVNVLCRVQKENLQRWNKLIESILGASLDEIGQVHGWKTHICQNYFLRETEQGRKMVWGWNVSIFSMEMSLSLDMVVRVLHGQPLRVAGSNHELTEFPLHGAPTDRNAVSASGKGVRGRGEGEFHPGKTGR